MVGSNGNADVGLVEGCVEGGCGLYVGLFLDADLGIGIECGMLKLVREKCTGVVCGFFFFGFLG